MSRNQMLAIATFVFLSAGSSVVQAQPRDSTQDLPVPRLLANNVTLEQGNVLSEPVFMRGIGQSSWKLEFPMPTRSLRTFTESTDLDDWERSHYPERPYRPAATLGISLRF